MRNFWKIFLLLLVNIIVSISATLAALYYWENIRNAEQPYTLITTTQQETTVPTEATAIPVIAEAVAPTESSHEEFIPPTRGALVTIPLVMGEGLLDKEAVRIQSNTDIAVQLAGWTLEDSEQNIYTFPNIQLIRNGVFIEVYSRSGHDTPYELYWNADEALWQTGETVVLKDMDDNIQATYRIP